MGEPDIGPLVAVLVMVIVLLALSFLERRHGERDLDDLRQRERLARRKP